jgi:hypothetical protein
VIDRDQLERAWPTEEPSSGFAERVLERARRESGPVPASGFFRPAPGVSRRMARAAAIASAAALGLGGLWLAGSSARAPWVDSSWLRGTKAVDVVAESRRELALGNLGRAVLEPGAHLTWGAGTLWKAIPRNEVEQHRGDIFYRVESGAALVVKTPMGDVAVRGTCFRIQLREPEPEGMADVLKRTDMLKRKGPTFGAGTALGAVAMVFVYEGRVEVSSAGTRLELDPGETAVMGSDGVERIEAAEVALASGTGFLMAGRAASTAELAQQDEAALRRDIGALGRQLRRIEAEKSTLARQLGRAEAELARREGGERPGDRDDFDFDREDWKRLAETGTIKYRLPCYHRAGWSSGDEDYDRLALAPDDAELLRAALDRSYQRVWTRLRALCVEAIGNEAAVDVLGLSNCTHAVLSLAESADRESTSAAMRAVAETRAGERPAPAPGVPQHPVFELFWTLTGEAPAVEAELAQSLGPEDAKRIVYGEGPFHCTSSYGRSR